MSDNNIPKPVEINMLMVFGIKSHDISDTSFTISGKIDPRLAKKQTMTTFHVNMQANFGDKKNSESMRQLDLNEKYAGLKKPENEGMIKTFEEATANIANAVEIRDMKHDRNYLQSYMRGGIGHGTSTT